MGDFAVETALLPAYDVGGGTDRNAGVGAAREDIVSCGGGPPSQRRGNGVNADAIPSDPITGKLDPPFEVVSGSVGDVDGIAEIRDCMQIKVTAPYGITTLSTLT